MKAEIAITDGSVGDLKAAAIDIQAALQGYGWMFRKARVSSDPRRIVITLEKPESVDLAEEYL